jgi:hypothetical protein
MATRFGPRGSIFWHSAYTFAHTPELSQARVARFDRRSHAARAAWRGAICHGRMHIAMGASPRGGRGPSRFRVGRPTARQLRRRDELRSVTASWRQGGVDDTHAGLGGTPRLSMRPCHNRHRDDPRAKPSEGIVLFDGPARKRAARGRDAGGGWRRARGRGFRLQTRREQDPSARLSGLSAVQ